MARARALIGPRERKLWPIRIGFALCSLAVLVVAVATLLPFVWMLLTSLRPANDLFQFPAHWLPSRWDFSSYEQALIRLPLLLYLSNTLVICTAVVAGQLMFSALAAYALARLRPRFSGLWSLAFAATLMVPVEALVVPLYLQLRSFPTGATGFGLNLLNTPWALILPGLVSAFNIFVLRSFFKRLPGEILDSALLDGCSEWGTFFRFVLPLTRPILVVLGIFGFIATWNGFFWPLVALSDPAHYTLMLGVQKMLETGEPWNIVMAAVTLTTLPTVILFLALQRWISKGLAFNGLYQ
jgi:multiple sugar transport system permease protein